jgi:beta-lactamase regulating signal transducer with metallopeptidase domain
VTAFLIELFEANLAAAAAILAVMAARKQVHRLLGPGAAYLLWAVVPAAMLATFVPSRTVLVMDDTAGLSNGFWDAVLSPAVAGLLVLVWAAGAVFMAASVVKRQRLFVRDMELGTAGPAVVGFFYPSIVTPTDFTICFSPYEQKLILAHEQVHLERYDARINALIALARCLCWFNPLIHLGARTLRADQELSCDAAVIERRPRARRAYAETLLKTQLAERSLPVGCYWPASASHPLTERIAMLTRSPFSDGRRLAAAAAALALVGGGGFAAWAAQPAREVLTSLPEIFVTFDPIVSDEMPGLRVRLIPGSSFSVLDEADDAPERTSPATP